MKIIIKGGLYAHAQSTASWRNHKEFCIEPLNLSVTGAANALGVTRKTLSALLNGRSGISPEMALRLSKVFGRTPEGWLRLQLQFDLSKTEQSVDIRRLKRLEANV